MKKVFIRLLAGILMFCLVVFITPNQVNAATLICSKCGVAYSDLEIMQERKGHERCSVGGKKHYFYPAGGDGHPESTGNYKLVVKQLQGNWYNERGTCITVDGKYFSGCRILSVTKIAGGGSNFGATFTLDEAEDTRNMHISVQIVPEARDDSFSDGMLKPRIYVNNVAYYRK